MSATMISLLIVIVLGSTGGKAGGLAAKGNGFGIVGNPLIGLIVSFLVYQGLISIGILLSTQYILIAVIAVTSSFIAVVIGSFFKKEKIRFSEED